MAALLLGLLAAILVPTLARAADATVAVAANFSAALEELIPPFERMTGHRLRHSVGSTGKLFAQIQAGAPFDAFLAADQERPRRLEQAGLALPGNRFTYARGVLVLWSGAPELLAEQAGSTGDLRNVSNVIDSSAVRHLAIANPRLAPYGVAARQVLDQLGLTDRVARKLVIGNDVGEIFAMVATGNAEAGFVALANVLAYDATRRGSHWVVPETLYDPILQDAVLLSRAANNPAAKAFLEYLRSPPARAIIRRHGYGDEMD